MALSKDLTVLFCDVSVAIENTPMPEGDPVYVYVEPPGLHENNDLSGASRLFHEHFADVLTSRLGFTRSDAQPTPFVELALNAFLIMDGSSTQLCDVVSEMEQYFTMKVTLPLSDSAAQTYEGARYLRHNDATWELPTTRYEESMLGEQGMTSANPVVTPALARDVVDDEDEDEANSEEHRILRRVVGKKESVFCSRRPDIAFATNRLARSWLRLQNQNSSPRNVFALSLWHAGFWFEAADAQQGVRDSDSTTQSSKVPVRRDQTKHD